MLQVPLEGQWQGFKEVVFGQGVTLRKGVNNIMAREPQGSAAYLGK